MKYFLVLIGCFFFIAAQGQHTLAFYNDVMVNAMDGKHRAEAAKTFNSEFINELKKPGSFDNGFVELKWVSQKSDKDRSFRIFTWQVEDEKGKFSQYGVIQHKDGKVFVLADKSVYEPDMDYAVMGPDQWLGALYYNIIETKTEKGKAWLLFGYDGGDGKNRMKVVDVLSFSKEGVPVFGAELFLVGEGKRPDLKTRIGLPYSALANVNFNYSVEQEMIVHDFIVARMGIDPSGDVARVPDGTYTGYKWDGKYWKKIDQLATVEMAPTDIFFQPKKEEGPKKDLFGRKKE
ncbi:MAG: hypothetical protein IPK46_17385 [Saprospiraceae bacterium]|nr:hypothetical protein [Saprospiraceae bacterium]